jgi:hypothetical protein
MLACLTSIAYVGVTPVPTQRSEPERGSAAGEDSYSKEKGARIFFNPMFDS